MSEKNLVATLPYSETYFKWISKHYDLHLEGTCIFNNKLCKFKTNYIGYDEEKNDWTEVVVNIYSLNIAEKLKWRWRQWKFEQCVGYHYTYLNKKKVSKNFYYRKPKWLYTWLFKVYYKQKN